MPSRRAVNSRTVAAVSGNGATLAEAANLGPKSVAVLERAGITSLQQLKQLGSIRAFSLAKSAEPTVTLNLLWALEGAVLGQPWQAVAREHRGSLLLSLEDHERHLKA